MGCAGRPGGIPDGPEDEQRHGRRSREPVHDADEERTHQAIGAEAAEPAIDAGDGRVSRLMPSALSVGVLCSVAGVARVRSSARDGGRLPQEDGEIEAAEQDPADILPL